MIVGGCYEVRHNCIAYRNDSSFNLKKGEKFILLNFTNLNGVEVLHNGKITKINGVSTHEDYWFQKL